MVNLPKSQEKSENCNEVAKLFTTIRDDTWCRIVTSRINPRFQGRIPRLSPVQVATLGEISPMGVFFGEGGRDILRVLQWANQVSREGLRGWGRDVHSHAVG
ncbi:hypothetical protein CEXT_467441 [Caerostris extrusa]|uniref:Uncharacterized protein n=1 Tax=Caerostris extrusa TaxID=172846 RepID=A0AAV4NZ17_CAEEX|nr:hypothetical protein CEXT_467441 [Caerostris extrusa]